jgi:hypothetical protein
VLGGNVFVLQAAGLFNRQVEHTLEARRDKHLAGAAAAIDRSLGPGAQHVLDPAAQRLYIRPDVFENLQDNAIRLLDQREQEVLHIHLRVPVFLCQLGGARGGFLRAFRKAVKAHHRSSPIGL